MAKTIFLWINVIADLFVFKDNPLSAIPIIRLVFTIRLSLSWAWDHIYWSQTKRRLMVNLWMETVLQLLNPPYSQYFSPWDLLLFPLLKSKLSRRRYESKDSLGSAFFSVYRVCPKGLLIFIRAWVSRQETEFLSKENPSTSWNEWNMKKCHNAPFIASVPQLNECLS